MLLHVDCEPKIVASITLSYDDGSSKEVDIKKGMYGTFSYMNHGVSSKITGRVVDVALAVKRLKPVGCYDVPNHVGYQNDPNYVNSGFLDTRDPHHRHPDHHCHVHSIDSNDLRNYIEVEGIGQYINKRVRIDVYSISDIIVAWEDSKEVATPDTVERIRLIRNNNGVLEFTTDGVEWISAVGTDYSTDIATLSEAVRLNSDSIDRISEKVDSIQPTTDLSELTSKVDNASAAATRNSNEIVVLQNKIRELESKINTES